MVSEAVSLKPDCKTAHKTAQINSDGRASRMTALPHDRAGSHLTTPRSILKLLKI